MLSIGSRAPPGIASAPGRSGRVVGGNCHLDSLGYFDNADVPDRDLAAHFDLAFDRPASLKDRLPPVTGHFAVAAVSNDMRASFLVADPFGTLPVYYARSGQGWAWSFELRRLVAHLATRSLDLNTVDEIFVYHWTAHEDTLLSEVKQVLPGHYVYLEAGREPEVFRYARYDFAPERRSAGEDAYIAQTDEALDSYLARIRRRYPRLAVFLSGGVDSSLLVAKARAHGFDRLVAVTAGWPGRANVEADRAKAIARHLGVEHRIVDVPDDYVAGAFKSLVWQLGRPPKNFSNFAVARMFEALRSEVDFVIGGEGADRMFGTGMVANIWRYDAKQRAVRWLPRLVRRHLAAVARASGAARGARLAYLLTHSTVDYIRHMLTHESPGSPIAVPSAELVPQLAALRRARRVPFLAPFEPADPASFVAYESNLRLYTGNRTHYLDHAAFAKPQGLEVGFPFLAPEICRIGLTLPDEHKADARGAKPILKKLASRYLPEAWVYASKMQFDAPITDWLRGPLGLWRDVLFEERTLQRGLFDRAALARLDIDHDHETIWIALGLEVFIRQFIEGDPAWIPPGDPAG